MKPSKDENEVASRVKATTKYAYVAPGAVGKGRGRGLKSMLSLGVSRTDIPFSPSTNHVMQYNQFTETSMIFFIFVLLICTRNFNTIFLLSLFLY